MEKQLPETMKKFLDTLKEKAKDYPDLYELFVTCYTNTQETSRLCG